MTEQELAAKMVKLFTAWKNMLNRCNPRFGDRYGDYAGRGITVCERWRSFENFVADMGASCKEGLTLERSDNSGNYTPDNCCWVTPKEQLYNRRNTIRIDTPSGPQFLKELSRQTGLGYYTLRMRYHRGDRWPGIIRPVTQGGNQSATGCCRTSDQNFVR